MEWSQIKLRDAAELIAEQSYVNPESLGQGAWGAFSCGNDHPGAIGAFQWFSSRDELATFLSDHDILIWKDFDNEKEYNALRQELKEILSDPEEDRCEVIDKFNESIQSSFQVEWFGTLDELMNSTANFPKKVRSCFYETYSIDDEAGTPDEGNTEIIHLSLRKEFAVFLDQYGL